MLHKEIRPSNLLHQALGAADMQYTVNLPLGSRGNWDKVIEWLNKDYIVQDLFQQAYKEFNFNDAICVITNDYSLRGNMARVSIGPVGGPKVRASFRTLMYMVHTRKVVLIHPTCDCKNCVNPYHQKEVGEYTSTVKNLKDKLDAAKQGA